MSVLMIDVPDDLRARGEALAALRGRIYDEVMAGIVRQVLADALRDALEDAEDIQAVEEFEAREARVEVELEDWETVKAELHALPY